jgi:acyl carrier protein
LHRRFHDVLEAVLGVDPNTLEDSDSPKTVPQWDSVTHLQLMLALEAEFGLEFSPEDMAQLTSIGLLRDRLGVRS